MTALIAVLFLNELHIDPVAALDADAEWIEVHNPGAQAVDLSGWRLLSQGDAGHTFPLIGGPHVAAGGYLVLGASTNRSKNGDAPVGYAYGSSVRLADNSDEVRLVRDDLAVEAQVAYGIGWPHLPGRALALASLDRDPAQPASWCAAMTAFGAGDKGTPNAPNDCPEATDGGPAFGEAGSEVLRISGKVDGAGGCTCAAAGPADSWPALLLAAFLRRSRPRGIR